MTRRGLPPDERFSLHVERSDGCWKWTGAKNPDGYGHFRLNGVTYTAHRIAWFLANGEIPPGAHVLHTCDDRGCVNPAHLYLGTHQDNMADAWSRERYWNMRKDECKHGHPFTPDNTYIRPNGSRACRTCLKIRKWNFRKRAKETN